MHDQGVINDNLKFTSDFPWQFLTPQQERGGGGIKEGREEGRRILFLLSRLPWAAVAGFGRTLSARATFLVNRRHRRQSPFGK